ncbi:MAG: hypothetical protein QOF36_2536 [Microbacteriaceae bacterium]|jgi:hypothetical protein|nr:hypothetical protein [Microbacteriaceae bacterium]
MEPQDQVDETVTTVETSEGQEGAQEGNVSQPPIFAYSRYLDLPEECEAEQAKRGSCKDPEHFHAWLRLPNKFEHKEIRDEALAAKARKARALRMEGSNAYEVLEEEMDRLLSEADTEDIIVELLSLDHAEDVEKAKREVMSIEADPLAKDDPSDEDEEPVLLYEHIDRDQARLDELQDMPESERPEDEYVELLNHVHGYYTALDKELQAIQEPAREAFRAKEKSELVNIIRQARIRAEGTQEFLHVYNAHQWVAGTLKSDKSGRKFGDLEHLKSAAPEVVTAIQMAFYLMENDDQAGKA